MNESNIWMIISKPLDACSVDVNEGGWKVEDEEGG